MDTFFLAQLFGVYLIIEGLVLLTRQSFVRKVVSEMMHSSAMCMLAGFLMLALGLVLVLNHNVWEWSVVGVITLISWLILLKSIVYLFLPEKTILRWAKPFDTKGWYLAAGVVVLLLGLYLVNIGFALGWMM